MKWIFIFFVLGLLFGLAADKYAWLFLIVPLVFIGMAFFMEGPSIYALITGLVSVGTTAAGIIVGHLIVFRRFQPREG